MMHHTKRSRLIPLLILISLLLPMGALGEKSSKDLDRGRALYRGHCAACHGLKGEGNGPGAKGLTKTPTNFRDAAVMSALSDGAIQMAILAGKPESGMRGYGTILTAQDVSSLVKYLRSLATAP